MTLDNNPFFEQMDSIRRGGVIYAPIPIKTDIRPMPQCDFCGRVEEGANHTCRGCGAPKLHVITVSE